jgi:hypothetical protein
MFTNYVHIKFHVRRYKPQILNIINAHYYFLKYVSCIKAMKTKTAGERDVSTFSLRQ